MNCTHFLGRYGRLQFGDVYTCHGFFQKCASLKKLIPKHFFKSLLNNLSRKDLVTFGNLLSIKFMKPKRRFYGTPSRQA